MNIKGDDRIYTDLFAGLVLIVVSMHSSHELANVTLILGAIIAGLRVWHLIRNE